MDERSLEAIDFLDILKIVASLAHTEGAKSAIIERKPAIEAESVRNALKKTESAMFWLNEAGDISLHELKEVDLSKPEGISYSITTILQVRKNLQYLKSVKLSLTEIKAQLEGIRDIIKKGLSPEKLLDFLDKRLGPAGEILDSASKILQHIRRRKELVKEKTKERIAHLLANIGESLQDEWFTIRNGRLVLPVIANKKNRVKGIIHDRSGSGQTFFIEPFEIVESNNALSILETEENEEIRRILLEISNEIYKEKSEIINAIEALVELDRIFAIARFSKIIYGIKPEINETGEIKIFSGRHPLLDPALKSLREKILGRKGGDNVVPLTICLGKKEGKTLVVSGPNAGGKTVTIKTVAILSAMSQIGSFIPADEGTSLPVFSNIFASIGDEQSIMDSLSTFSSRMAYLSGALREEGRFGLYLIDEIGSGTDPAEGSAIGESILLAFHKKSGMTLCSTHYESLKALASSTKGMRCASMEFEEDGLKPTYRLLLDRVGSSHAIDIAEKSGLPKEVIEEAKKRVSEESILMTKRLNALDSEMRLLRVKMSETEERSRQLEKDHEEYLHKEKKWGEERVKILEKFSLSLKNAEEEMLQAVKSSPSIRKRAESKRREKIAEFSEDIGVKKSMIEIKSPANGDFVYLPAFGLHGRVVGIDNAKMEVSVSSEGKVLRVGLSDVVESQKTDSFISSDWSNAFNDDSSCEINLIGMRVEEAISSLEQFLDRALLKNLPSVRIIHGIGTGALKSAVRKYLKSRQDIEVFKETPQHLGGAGVTLAGFK